MRLMRKLGERAVVHMDQGDVVIDVRKQPFPKYLFAIEQVIRTLPAEKTIKLVLSHARFIDDLTVWCRRYGHEFLGSEVKKRQTTVRIKKGS